MYPLYLFLLSMVLVPLSAAQADTLTIPNTPSMKQKMDMPTRGMSMEQVTERFGQPENRLPPVGEPPITRWRYGHYTVYFEGKYVIHSVPDKR